MDLNSALYLIHFYHKKRKKKKEIAQQQGTKNETIIKILFKKSAIPDLLFIYFVFSNKHYNF